MDILVFVGIALTLCLTAPQTALGGQCSLRDLSINNGKYRLQSGNSVAKYSCQTGYILYGSHQIVCFGTVWSGDPPICIANTCPKIQPTSTLQIAEEYEGAVLKFSCVVSYKLLGQDRIICDGENWSHAAPTCIAWTPPTSCDFESSDLCGWSHHEEDDLDWRWNSGKTKTSRTGPEHDHTHGKNGDGHYMYFETSSPTRTGHNAILLSPLYPAPQVNQCLKFWYHVLGVGHIGDLEVKVKPDGADLSKLDPLFVVNENKGEDWQFQNVDVGKPKKAFQILFVATRGSSYRSDMAIDDVTLYDCPLPTTTAPTTNPTQTTQARRSTDKFITSIPTTYTGRTTVKVPPFVTTSHKMVSPYSTTNDKTPSVTGQKSTPTQIVTRDGTRKSTPNPGMTFTTSGYTGASVVTRVTGMLTRANNATTTTIPRINPSVPVVKSSKMTDRDGASNIPYILVGVGLVLAICIVAGGVFYFIRKRKVNRRPTATLLSMDDEATIQFVQADQTYDNMN